MWFYIIGYLILLSLGVYVMFIGEDDNISFYGVLIGIALIIIGFIDLNV